MGTPDFSIPTLQKLYDDKDINISYVVTKMDSKSSRGQKINFSDVKKKALEDKLVSITNYEKFIINYKVDEKLIAGLKIKIDDKVIDKTYKTKMLDLTKSLRGLKL